MKILSIVWYKVLPAKFGGQKGTALFNKHLANHFPLVCLCSRNNNSTETLSYKLLPNLPEGKIQFIDPISISKILQTARKEKATHIILEHPYHGIAGSWAKKRLGVKLIVHSHNIECLRFKEQKKWWWKLLYQLEKWTHRKADLNFFKTETDLKNAIDLFKLKKETCILVPYGFEPPAHFPDRSLARNLIREKYSIPADHKIIFFAGTLDYKPNAEAVEAIYQHIIPLLIKENRFPFKIVVSGRNRFRQFQYLKNLKHPNLIYAGEVDDIENYFAAADLFINPVQTATGMQTKIIEAIGYHLNTIVFESQMQGIHAELCSNKIFVSGNNWNDFVGKIINASQVQTPTPRAFFEYYDWNRIVSTLAKEIRQL